MLLFYILIQTHMNMVLIEWVAAPHSFIRTHVLKSF